MQTGKEKFDVVLAKGRVIDPETYLDGIYNVGIKGDRIAAISAEPLDGKEVVDCTGMIVSPGFIDMHAHGQNIPSARIQAFDGVTTGLELEAGILPVGEFYDNCAKEGRPIKDVALESTELTAEELDRLLDPAAAADLGRRSAGARRRQRGCRYAYPHPGAVAER